MYGQSESRRGFLKHLGVGAAALSLSGIARSAEKKTKPSRPNIVLIIGDDISWGDFGCYGHPHIHTPNTDRLAVDGVRFTNAYLTISSCSPTRCSVLTGRYPHNTGAPELHMPLPEGQVMFPELLKQNGYYTVQAGKWHMGEYAKRAFDDVFSGQGGGPGAEQRWVQCLRERPKDKPFFAWFASTDAHRGWDDKDKKLPPHKPSDAVIPPYMADMPGTRSDLARYYDEVQRFDRYIGDVVEELKRQGELDNTVIMIMGDNGRPFPRCKTWLYDGGVKTALVVHWPKGIQTAGVTSDSLVSVIDIAPTVLEIAGVRRPKTLQGFSFAPALNDTDAEIRDYAFAEQNWHDITKCTRLVRWKNYTYKINLVPELPGWAMAHHDTPSYKDLFKLKEEGKLTPAQANVLASPRPAEELYDVFADPHQLDNLVDSEDHKEVLDHLRKVMKEWRERTGDSVDPNKLTAPTVDLKTYEFVPSGYRPKERGEVPGEAANAARINDPGPH